MEFFELLAPADGVAPTPLVLDSPHSGTHYPGDFGFAPSLPDMRDAEDTFVDALYGQAPQMGVWLLKANFPRSYIDPNRDATDLDYGLIRDLEKPAGMVQWEEKLALGKGLIWKYLDTGAPVYDRLLTAAEVERRLENCYRPYWSTLRNVVAQALARHGQVVHINCHSMPSVAGPLATTSPGVAHPDVVLGDRHGTACSPVLTEALAGVCRDAGLDVAINVPYPGGPITREMGLQGLGAHGMQIELNRALYMDETERVPNGGFEATRELCTRIMQTAIEVARQLAPLSAQR